MRFFDFTETQPFKSACRGLRFVPLRTLQPYHWTRAYPPEGQEHYVDPCE